MFSPRTRSLNSFSCSSTSTLRPLRATVDARADPPRPPPTVITSTSIRFLPGYIARVRLHRFEILLEPANDAPDLLHLIGRHRDTEICYERALLRVARAADDPGQSSDD